MIRWKPFVLEDLELIPVQEAHAEIREQVLQIPKNTLTSMLECAYAGTAWSVYGVPVACCGIIPSHDLVWAFLASDMRQYMLPVTRRITTAMNDYGRAVIAEIDEGYDEAVRWVELLGFERQDEGIWVRYP